MILQLLKNLLEGFKLFSIPKYILDIISITVLNKMVIIYYLAFLVNMAIANSKNKPKTNL